MQYVTNLLSPQKTHMNTSITTVTQVHSFLAAI